MRRFALTAVTRRRDDAVLDESVMFFCLQDDADGREPQPAPARHPKLDGDQRCSWE